MYVMFLIQWAEKRSFLVKILDFNLFLWKKRLCKNYFSHRIIVQWSPNLDLCYTEITPISQ